VSTVPVLVLLTDYFPYGNVSETFLETEIETLAERFEQVLVLPSHRAPGIRPLPPNVELVTMDWLEEPSSAAKWRALASRESARVLTTTLAARPRLRSYLRRRRLYLDNLARAVLKSRSLAAFARERRLEDALFYDYWLENSTLALALLRAAGKIRVGIARAHSFDVYDENWGGDPIPFQDYKGKGLDVVFAISMNGRDHLEQQVPSLRGTIRVQRLGVPEPQQLPPAGSPDKPLVVSCARMADVKRVDMIPEVLAGFDRPVRWIHFGDGPARARVEAAARKLPANVEWELRGQVDNRAVLEFYARNHVDALVSFSISEGLPVSMMEAQSYGIPIVACGINGVPEIVTAETGVCLPADVGVAAATEALASVLDPGRFDRDRVRAFFENNFKATVNYNSFSDEIIDVWKTQAQAA
jgi:glycosyltransferase involved in cell wall biosynthesis